MYIRGIQLVAELLLFASDSLLIQCRDLEHLHEDILLYYIRYMKILKKQFLTKLQHFELRIFFSLFFFMMDFVFSDSAGTGNSTCIRTFPVCI